MLYMDTVGACGEQLANILSLIFNIPPPFFPGTNTTTGKQPGPLP